ncbi:MAG: penicillin acylase family protein, partial [Lewinella sp.]|nr:penicillin acylase family protein [Lewinella sp.]
GLLYVGHQHGVLGARVPAPARFLNPFTGFWQQAEAASPNFLEHHLQDWPARGRVTVDDRGVPHIFAPTKTDAAFLLGYWHAKDRLWQMDISTRATVGRLAEVMGPSLLERDRLQRRKGMRIAAERSLAAWKEAPEEMEILEAYSLGVNRYIDQLTPADYPVEFKLLGYEPEHWSPLHSAIFFKSMAETLSFRNHDLITTQTKAFLGDSLFQDLFPEYNPRQSPIIPTGTPWDFLPVDLDSVSNTQLSGTIGHIPHQLLPIPDEGIGSNNWALAGSRTASGSPLLSNDPHLSLTLPAIWYEAHIHTPELNTYGVSLPGIPGIVIGFNEQVAWGMTNASHDVLDWYRIDWVDSTRQAYWLDGERQSPDWIMDTIWVRGQTEPVVEEIPWTVWGPVTYAKPDEPYYDMAMRWTAHDRPEEKEFYEVGVFWRLMAARNYQDYRTALRGFENPAQNFVFAAADGDIGMTVNGKLPLKYREQGRFVQDGAHSAGSWQGFIPNEQVPAAKNPARGFVASANQRSTDRSYPYYYNGSFDDYRGRYINRRLEQMTAATPDSMMALQNDAYSLLPEDALPVMLALLDTSRISSAGARALQLLRQWDYRYQAEAVAPSLFEDWRDRAYDLTFDEFDQLEEAHPGLGRPSVEWWRLIELMADHPAHPIFDRQGTPERE